MREKKTELDKKIDERLKKLNGLYGNHPIEYKLNKKTEMMEGKGEGFVVRFFFSQLELKYVVVDKDGERGKSMSKRMTRPQMIKYLDSLIEVKKQSL